MRTDKKAMKIFDEGIELYEQSKFSEAEKLFKKALDIMPDSEDIMYNLALTYFEQGKYKEAQGTMKNMQKLDCSELIGELRKKGVVFDKPAEHKIPSIKSISPETIKEVVKTVASKKAVNSLMFWGVLNCSIWLLSVEEFFRPFGQYHPNFIEIVLHYGGVFIGVMMVVFSLYGTFSKKQFVIAFDGISISILGVWNMLYKFLVIAAGYNFEEISNFWGGLGLLQLIWGISRIKFGRYIGFAPVTMNDDELDENKRIIKNFIDVGPIPGDGILKFNIPRDIYKLDKAGDYFVHIRENDAICIKDNISLYFMLNRSDKDRWKIKKNNIIKIRDASGRRWKAEFEGLSFNHFKMWAGL